MLIFCKIYYIKASRLTVKYKVRKRNFNGALVIGFLSIFEHKFYLFSSPKSFSIRKNLDVFADALPSREYNLSIH